MSAVVLTTRHFGIRVLTQVSVQDGITDLVTDLICKIRFKSSLWSFPGIPSETSRFQLTLASQSIIAKSYSSFSGLMDVRMVLALTRMSLTHRLRGEHEGVLTGSMLVEPIRGAVHVSELPVLL